MSLIVQPILAVARRTMRPIRLVAGKGASGVFEELAKLMWVLISMRWLVRARAAWRETRGGSNGLRA